MSIKGGMKMNEIIKREYENLVKYYEASGGDSKALISKEYAYLVINKDKILSKNSTDGIIIEAKKIENGVYAEITIKKGYKSDKPVHLCFGMLPKEGKQIIKTKIIGEEESKVKFLAHCIFPNAVKVEHIMDSEVHAGKNTKIEYEEIHFHGKSGGVKVIPKTRAWIEEGGEYNSSFIIKSGRVGMVDIDYEVHLGKEAKSMLISKIYAKKDDSIRAKESIYLEGAYSSGVVKTRMALKDNARSEVIGKTVGIGDYSHGHVDCTEIIMDNAVAKASPVVMAENPKAKVTHEAAIGSVDKKQLLTLLTRGLKEEEAIDIIVGGLLK